MDSRNVRHESHDGQDQQYADDDADKGDKHDPTAGCHDFLDHRSHCMSVVAILCLDFLLFETVLVAASVDLLFC